MHHDPGAGLAAFVARRVRNVGVAETLLALFDVDALLEVIEGATIAALAVGAASVLIATKGRFDVEVRRLEDAIAEMRQAGWLGDLPIDVFIHEA